MSPPPKKKKKKKKKKGGGGHPTPEPPFPMPLHKPIKKLDDERSLVGDVDCEFICTDKVEKAPFLWTMKMYFLLISVGTSKISTMSNMSNIGHQVLHSLAFIDCSCRKVCHFCRWLTGG